MLHEYPYSIKRHGTTLEKCEDEPVQTPGCTQAHGVLLVLRQTDLTILQASENSHDWLGLSPQDLLGKNAVIAIGELASQEIRNALDHERLDKVPLYVTTLQARDQKNILPLQISLHTHSGLALLELEAATVSDTGPQDQMRADPDYYGLVRKTLTRFQETAGIKALSQAITEEVRRITELDRVMVYYFHANDSGEVIAESKREDQDPWLGFRYPAHDIPRPAREIFKKIWSRPVPDVRAQLYEMVPLLNPDTRKPLDMTYCSLRGASVMYTEYLDNMGVRAALTLPLMREGELWGLIACHHNTPKLISYRVRAASEFLARGASQQLRRAEEKENLEYRISLDFANYALIAKVALAPDLSAFTSGSIHLGSGLNCGGAAIFYQETWNQVGRTPEIQEMAALGQWLLTQPGWVQGTPNSIFMTDELSKLYPAGKAFAGVASGLMAFCFSRDPLGLVFFFKPETLQTMTWAGDPNELPVMQGPQGPRLSPRKSFEIWRETVSNRSMPWKKVEADTMFRLRGLTIDMLVSKAEQLNALRLSVAERTRELEQTYKQLLNSSRLAGMAEIATNVLHNLGNVLNSVNISAGLIGTLVKKSKSSRLDKVVALLREHSHDLGTFITEDPKGKGLPAYLANLSECLAEDEEVIVKESNSLLRNIEHIKEIVAMQQSYAKVSGVKEIINLRDLVEDSLRLSVEGMSRHNVEVIREFEEIPPVNVDRHKVLQVLVNLIRNAKHACQDSGRPDCRISVRLVNGAGRVKLSVADNGVGIPAENLNRIFNQGFTTRKYGHGFGLHSGALAVREMGGSLTVHSEGEGRGAIFTFELPCP